MTRPRDRVGRYVAPVTAVKVSGWRHRPGGAVEPVTGWRIKDARGRDLAEAPTPEDAARWIADLNGPEVTA
jgi:hypothetical protein